MPDTTPDTTMEMMLVAIASNTQLVTLDIALKRDAQEAWFTVSCPCGCEQGAVIVSLDGEALWLAAGLIEAVERLSGLSHPRRTA